MRSFPALDAPPRCVLIALDARLIPIIAGALKPLTQSYAWRTADDHQRGYNAIAELYAQMTSNCLSDLVRGQDRLYRLLDSALFGREYQQTGTDPVTGLPIIDPPPADIPAMFDTALPGLIPRIEALERLLDNALNGTVYGDYNDLPSIRARLEQILVATQETNDLDPQLLSELVTIAGLLA